MNHHDIAEWLVNAKPDEEIFLHLGAGNKHLRSADVDAEIAFRELAHRDAGFAHTFENLKRAADAKLIRLTYAGRCLFVTRLGDQPNAN